MWPFYQNNKSDYLYEDDLFIIQAKIALLSYNDTFSKKKKKKKKKLTTIVFKLINIYKAKQYISRIVATNNNYIIICKKHIKEDVWFCWGDPDPLHFPLKWRGSSSRTGFIWKSSRAKSVPRHLKVKNLTQQIQTLVKLRLTQHILFSHQSLEVSSLWIFFSHGPNFQSSNFHLYGFSFSIPRSSPSPVPPAIVLFFSLTSPSEISKFKLPSPRIFSLHPMVLTVAGAISHQPIWNF